MSANRVSRRGFFASGAAAGLLWGSHLTGCAQLPIGKARSGKARNIIFLVADGMNTGTWTIADYYMQHQSQQRSEWVKLYQEEAVTRALMETCSANSRVTDSAAAGSAWSSGQRIKNGAINVTPDGTHLVPIHDLVKKSHRSTGLVTTTRVTHATPATFASVVPKRGQEDAIALQYLERGVDVILGGGSKHFDGAGRKDKVDLSGRYQKAGYTVVESRDQLLDGIEGIPGRLLGTFWPTHLPYSIDRNRDAEIASQVPTLGEMMRTALGILEQNRAGFLLQVEGGRVDHAGHGNDVGAIVYDQIAFDECIAIARAYTQENPDTLVIVTTDHGCGGCQLNGVGAAYANTDKTFFPGIDAIGASYEHLQRVRGSLSAEQFDALVGECLQVNIDDEKRQQLAVAAKAGGFSVANLLRKWHDSFARTGVNWTSQNHTGEFVELAAWGPGSDPIKRWIRNTDLHPVMTGALALS